MKLSIGFLLLVTLFSGHVFTAAVPPRLASGPLWEEINKIVVDELDPRITGEGLIDIRDPSITGEGLIDIRDVEKWALTGLQDLVAEQKLLLRSRISKYDLYDEQIDKLVKKLSQKIIDYANDNNIESVLPSKWKEFVVGAQEYFKTVIDDLEKKAEKYQRVNTTGEGVIDIRAAKALLERRNVPLPGMVELLEELDDLLKTALNKLKDLNGQKRNQLFRDYRDHLKNFANIHGWHTLKPSQLKKYKEELTEFAQKYVEVLVARAEEYIKNNNNQKRDAGKEWRLNGIRDFLDDLKQILEDKTKKYKLHDEQREELVRELFQKITDYPNAHNIESLKPSEVKKYVAEVKAYAFTVLAELVQKAQKYEHVNVTGEGIIQPRDIPRIPILSDIIDGFKHRLEATLDKLTGLKKSQRKELLQDFVDQIKNFPLISGWDLLSPGKIKEYIEDVKVYSKSVVDGLVSKAKAYIKQNKEESSGTGTEGQALRGDWRLPGIRDVVDRIVFLLDQVLDKVTGLTKEQREELTKELLDELKNYPNFQNVTILKPSQVKEYLEEVYAFAHQVIQRLEIKAHAFAESNQKDRSARGVGDDINKVIDDLKRELENLQLTVKQGEKLMQELFEDLKNIPLPKIDFWKPIEAAKAYAKEVEQYLKNVYAKLIEKARELEKENLKSGAGKVTRKIEIPILSNIVDKLNERLETSLNKLTGLTRPQRKELLQEFADKLKNFPLISGWDLLSPSKITEYAKTVAEYGRHIIDSLVEKAKAFIELNKGETEVPEGTEEKRDLFKWPLPGIRDFIEKAQNQLDKTLDKFTGLTKDQREDLAKELRQELTNFPNSEGINFLVPSQVRDYLIRVDKFVDSVIASLQIKAQAMIEENKQKKTEKRAIELPQFVKDIQDTIVQTFKNAVSTITGLTHEQQDELVEEFKHDLSQMPIPPLKPWDFFNPIKFGKYIADLTKYNIELTKKYFQKATDWVKEKVSGGSDKARREIELPERIREIYERFNQGIRNKIHNVSGLTDEEQDQLIEDFKEALSRFPIPPYKPLDWFNPIKFSKFVYDIGEYYYQMTAAILKKAEAWVKGRKEGPKVHDVTGKTEEIIVKVPGIKEEIVIDANTGIEKIKKYIQGKLEELGLSKENQEKLLEELKVFFDNQPQPPTGWAAVNPINWVEYHYKNSRYLADTVYTILKKAAQLGADKLAQ